MRVFAAIAFLTVLTASQIAAEDRVIVRGDLGFEPLRLKGLQEGSRIELKGATFTVAISKNRSPENGNSCESGDLPVNRYPFAVEDSPGLRASKGRFDGTVPETSDWIHTYCNSAAIRIEASPAPDLRDMRMNLVWDGIRFDKGSPDFTVAQTWMTNVRDDCVENDHLLDGTIRDSLFDGCFAGISVATIDDNKARPTVKISDVLLRMQEYPYRGRMGHAMPIKIKVGGPKFTIKDSVFAVSTTNLIGGKHAPVMWDTITECSNNRLLWLGEGDLPEVYADVPDCFEVIAGEAAHQAWAKARTDWIAAHPEVPRLQGDPSE